MKKQVFQVLLIITFCSLPLIFLCSCGLSDTLMCTWCGDSSNRAVCYASGTTDIGGTYVEYKSCVGISGCIGIGCDTVCMPVECVQVEFSNNQSGCVVFYEDGCIDGEDVKSYGKYHDTTSCLGITCSDRVYEINDYGNEVVATEKESCMGISCGGKEATYPFNLNNIIPRQFPKGCWSCTGSEE